MALLGLFAQKLLLAVFNSLLGFNNVGYLLLAVGAVRAQVSYPLQGIVERGGRKDKVQVVISAAVLVGIDYATGILGAQGVELLLQLIYFKST